MERETNNFPAIELRCRCVRCDLTEPNQCSQEALSALQALRDAYDKPIVLASAYRCPEHPVEARKSKPGKHNEGVAFDIAVPWGRDRIKLIGLAMVYGFTGFGFANTFLHIDMRDIPTSWGYN